MRQLKQYIRDKFGKLFRGFGLEIGEDSSCVIEDAVTRQLRAGIRADSGFNIDSRNPSKLGMFKDNELDFIICVHYLEHFAYAKEIIAEWWRILKTGGSIVLAVPHTEFYGRVGEPGVNKDHRINLNNDMIEKILAANNISDYVIDVSESEEYKSQFVVLYKTEVVNATQVVDDHAIKQCTDYTVVIPFYGNIQMTQDCVNSIYAAGETPAEIICVDDGSEENNITIDGATVIRREKNGGFPAAVNTGVQAVNTQFVVLLNNDTIIKNRGLSRMLAALNDPNVAISGDGVRSLDNNYRSQVFTGIGKPDYVEMHCAAFRKSIWDEVGQLDTKFGKGYSEDSDWSIRATRLGYSLKHVPNVCDHVGRFTFGTGRDADEQIERNRILLLNKHHRGSALIVMGSVQFNGGGVVASKMGEALANNGWHVTVVTLNENPMNAHSIWDRFDVVSSNNVDEYYDLVISTFHSTMPFAMGVKCNNRVALIQSDEPMWDRDDTTAERNFRLEGFKCIVIADHMQEFSKKYGMNIIGQIDNGVDSLTFHPQWTFERKWPHSILFIRKGAPVWFSGEVYLKQAVEELAKKYDDFILHILGGKIPDWRCRIKHHMTYDRSEIATLMNNVTAVVVPSLIEGSSLIPLESMACGTPVVTTKIGVDYGIDRENVMFVPPENGMAIASAVSELFDSNELRRKLMLNGIQVAHARTWENEQKQFMDIINGLVGK